MTVLSQDIVARSEEGDIDHAAFWRRVNKLVEALQKQPGRRCALVCDSISNFVAGMLALGHLERTAIIPPTPQEGSLATCEAGIDLVVTDMPEKFPGFPTLPWADLTDQDTDTPHPINESAALEFYTSGSTGKPTCVPTSFAQLRCEMQEMELRWSERLGDAMVVATVPHYHRYGLLKAVLWPFLTGRTIYDRSCSTPVALRSAVGARTCVIFSSPAFLKRAGTTDNLPPVKQIRAVFSAGAPLPLEVSERMAREWGQPPIELYGSTETGLVAWRCWSEEEPRARWHPFPDVQAESRSTDAGQRLWVRSPYTDGWKATGDLAEFKEQNSFFLLGRVGSVVKIEDKRVSLNEMRERLLGHPWIRDAQLVVLSRERIQIGAAVVLEEAGRRALAENGRGPVRGNLQALLSQVYAPIVVPRKWRFVDAWPDNGMGKVKQQYLVELFEVQA